MASQGKRAKRAPRTRRRATTIEHVLTNQGRSRSAAPSQRVAAKRHRTLLHLALSQDVVDRVNTLLWLRVTAAGQSVEAIRGGKNQIYDETVEQFLQRFERRACEPLRQKQPMHG